MGKVRMTRLMKNPSPECYLPEPQLIKLLVDLGAPGNTLVLFYNHKTVFVVQAAGSTKPFKTPQENVPVAIAAAKIQCSSATLPIEPGIYPSIIFMGAMSIKQYFYRRHTPKPTICNLSTIFMIHQENEAINLLTQNSLTRARN